MKQWSYVNTAVQLINAYHGEEPFASFIKKYFSAHKKYGSKDRKQISHLCYCCFRLGKSTWPVSLEEKVLIGLFLCSDQPNDILEMLKPEWNQQVGLSIETKCALITGEAGTPDVFPWKEKLSNGISHEKFNRSFFTQPDLFIRLRPGHEIPVQEKLQDAALAFNVLKQDTLALPAGARLEEVIRLNKEAVVQDLSSQAVGDFMKEALNQPGAQGDAAKKVWDCCAASGGKSIMVYDIDPSIRLTVSDIRPSILINLRKRLGDAGIQHYQSFVADLSKQGLQAATLYDLIICDAPCTGSGTWGRTPEQLYFFEEASIQRYASLQQNIVRNIIPHLNENGFLLYITCSVFREENEDAVRFIEDNFSMELTRSAVIQGYQAKADTMFAVLFRKKGMQAEV